MTAPDIPLIEQSAWWILPYLGLILLMLHAMMEFSVTVLTRRPPKRKPVAAEELRRRLLALNQADLPQPLAPGQDCDLEMKWAFEDTRRSRLALSRQTSSGHVRFLLDEPRHELRIHQTDSGSSFFVGWQGWLPRLHGGAGFSAGPPGSRLTDQIEQVTKRCGWTVRPVLWGFQATHRGTHFLQTVTPAWVRRRPARRFWGVLYPLSFFAGIAYIVVITWPLEASDLWLIAGISAAWWAVWGFLIWALCGFPAFWRQRR